MSQQGPYIPPDVPAGAPRVGQRVGDNQQATVESSSIVVEVPGLGEVEFPAGTTEAQMRAAIQKQIDPVRMTPFKDGARPTSRAIESQVGRNADTASLLYSAIPVGRAAMAGGRLAMRAMAPKVVEKAVTSPSAFSTTAQFGRNTLTVPTTTEASIPAIEAAKGLGSAATSFLGRNIKRSGKFGGSVGTVLAAKELLDMLRGK